MLAPEHSQNKHFYTLFLQTDSSINHKFLTKFIENKLKENYHYLHAMEMKQLDSIRIFILNGTPDKQYRSRMHNSSGATIGDIKIPALSTELGW